MTDDRADQGISQLLDRRQLLRAGALAGAGLAAAALVGCGGDDDDEAASNAPAATGQAQTGAVRGKLIEDKSLPWPLNFPEPAKQPKPGGTMVVGATWDISSEDPTKSAAGGTITVPNMVYNRLLGFRGGPDIDPFAIHLEPELATNWERTPDGATFTFKIKPGVKWQNVAPLNGREFVAADAKYAYERYKAEGVHRSYWANVGSIEAPDKYTLKVNMSRVTADFLFPLASRYQTIFPRELVEDGSIDKKVVGTGPMILKDAIQSEKVTFVKNPDYFERPVLLDGWEFKIMPDHSARLASFRAEQLDYGYSVAASKRDVDSLLKGNPKIQINMLPVVQGGIPFGMNMQNPKFQDVRVRRAIALAIDSNQMNTVLNEGLGKALPLIPWPFVFDREPTLESGELGKWWRHDPAEARQLLQAAGVPNLTFNNIYFPYATTYDRWSEMLVEQFKAVGITMTGGKVDYTEFNSQWVGARLPEVTTTGWLPVGFDADNFFYNALHSKSPGNRWKISDPQLDQWAEQQQVELNAGKRRELHRKVWDRVQDEMYWPGLPQPAAFEIYQPWVRNIRFGGFLGTSSSYYDWGAQAAEAWLDK